MFGNPVKIGAVCPVCHQTQVGVGRALACYRRYLYWRITGNGPGQLVAKRARLLGSNLGPAEFRAAVLKLDGKTLVCPGCGIDAEKCHARILESALNWLKTR